MAGADPVERALNFLDTYRDFYDLRDAELSFATDRVMESSGETVVLSQTYRGLPVFASQISLSFDGPTFRSATGKLLHGEISLDTVPTLSPEQAVDAARTALQLTDAKPARQPVLMVFDLSLLTDVETDPRLVYLVDLLTADQPRAFIDAHNGELVESMTLFEPALDFEVRDGLGLTWQGNCAATTLFSLEAANEDGILPIAPDRFAAAYPDVQKAGDVITTTFYYFLKFPVTGPDGQPGWNSYDDLGGKTNVIVEIKILDTVAANTDCGLIFNPDTVTLDLMVHEFTHSVIAYTSGLEYKWQSGALNESFADIMASLVDGNWTFAEDIGAFRDLSDPPHFGQPDEYGEYLTTTDDKGQVTDAGGVHRNSGIMNKAVYLMTNGDTFNGVIIQGIGLGAVDNFLFESMTTLANNTDLPTAAFHLRYTVAPKYFTGQNLCDVHNALYAVQLMGDSPDLNCDGQADGFYEAGKDPDGDGKSLAFDNCNDVSNPFQFDTDNDDIGDACDEDADGDGAPETITSLGGFLGTLFSGGLDNCPFKPNPDQKDSDKDGLGDACDPFTTPDTDGDGVLDDTDNCKTTVNADQKDYDGDKKGDVCDPDKDQDGQFNESDNCYYYNPDQKDSDGDGLGDACDWLDNNVDYNVAAPEDGVLTLTVPICPPDESNWYSSGIVANLNLHTEGTGISVWVSNNTHLYLTKPNGDSDQTHLFTPHADQNYFLNVAFSDEANQGDLTTIQVNLDCGPFSNIPLTAPTAVPSSTPTPVTSGLELPFLTLLQNGNCRKGPGTSFEVLDLREEGFQSHINGRTPESAWLRVFLPEWNANCWFAASIVEVTGELSGAPTFDYPATPTFTPEPTDVFVPQCSDGIDNDGDTFIDDVDRECDDANDNDESS